MPPAAPLAIQATKLLLVEGKDEISFFTAMLRDHLHLGGVQVIEYAGKAKLSSFLKTLVADAAFPTVTAIGIVRDADQTSPGSTTTAAVAAFAAIQSALTATTIPMACPLAHGQFTNTTPRVGVYIMPNGSDDGMLETLCLDAVSGQPEYPCVLDYFSCLQIHGVVPK